MEELNHTLIAIWIILIGVFGVLVYGAKALWLQVEQRRKANAIAERMAQLLERQ